MVAKIDEAPEADRRRDACGDCSRRPQQAEDMQKADFS